MLCCGNDNVQVYNTPKIKNLTLRQFNQCIKALDMKVTPYTTFLIPF